MNAVARRTLSVASIVGVLLAWKLAADRPRVFPAGSTSVKLWRIR